MGQKRSKQREGTIARIVKPPYSLPGWAQPSIKRISEDFKGSQWISKDLKGPQRLSRSPAPGGCISGRFGIDSESILGFRGWCKVDLGSIWDWFGVDSGIPWLGGGGRQIIFGTWGAVSLFPPGCLRRCFFVSLGRAGWPTTRARNKNWNIKNEPNHMWRWVCARVCVSARVLMCIGVYGSARF